jgi:hypothetical protein
LPKNGKVRGRREGKGKEETLPVYPAFSIAILNNSKPSLLSWREGLNSVSISTSKDNSVQQKLPS